MAPDKVEIKRQKGYIRFTPHKEMTFYEITDLLRLKNMLEMEDVYRKIDAKVISLHRKSTSTFSPIHGTIGVVACTYFCHN